MNNGSWLYYALGKKVVSATQDGSATFGSTVSQASIAEITTYTFEDTTKANYDNDSFTFAHLNAEDGIRIWSNVEENVRKRMKEGKSAIPKEVSIYQMVNASFLTTTDKSLKKINNHIRNIPFMKLADEAAAHGMSEGDYKRMKIDQNLQARNDLLEAVINKLSVLLD